MKRVQALILATSISVSGMTGYALASAQLPVSGTDAPPLISAREIDAASIRGAALVASSGKQGVVTPLLTNGPYRLNLEYRIGASPAVRVHRAEGEIFFVLGGRGIMTVGGRLVEPITQGSDVVAKTSIGGTDYTLGKGDVLLFPAGTAYPITKVTGDLQLLSMHLPWPHDPRELPVP